MGVGFWSIWNDLDPGSVETVSGVGAVAGVIVYVDLWTVDRGRSGTPDTPNPRHIKCVRIDPGGHFELTTLLQIPLPFDGFPVPFRNRDHESVRATGYVRIHRFEGIPIDREPNRLEFGIVDRFVPLEQAVGHLDLPAAVILYAECSTTTQFLVFGVVTETPGGPDETSHRQT